MKRLHHDTRVFLLALGAALPALTVAEIVLWTGDFAILNGSPCEPRPGGKTWSAAAGHDYGQCGAIDRPDGQSVGQVAGGAGLLDFGIGSAGGAIGVQQAEPAAFAVGWQVGD